MSYESWLGLIKAANKSSIIQGKVRKVHYRFPDGREMAEEYSTDTGVVLRRAWKNKTALLQKEEWTIELGDSIPVGLKENELMLRESCSEPMLSKRVTRNALEWRIRNLPFPISIYTVTCEENDGTITVRTSNKKYFKKIEVPELKRCNICPSQEGLTVAHKNCTLIITYKKPAILLDMERAILTILQDVETVECNNYQCEDILSDLMIQ
ncbi:protein DPCD [Anopheles funestus]|uniref:Protein DPCD n=1 Tax=Anopheles funestus TaxID=62324 RepID=A0A182RJV2_ANOFN|nr:protein DPCD [Anopheles funestus]XP_049295155.1 protein DPCD [Anopheles funestus]